VLARIRKAIEEKDEGFTLIELLVVIIIIGILAAIAIPVFLNQRKKGYDAQAKSDLRNFASLEETFFTDKNAYAGTLDICTGTGGDCTGIVAISRDTVLKVSAIGTDGWCAYSSSNKGTATTFYVYDSKNGGMQPATVSTVPLASACSAATPAAPAAGTPVGSLGGTTIQWTTSGSVKVVAS